jgi:hypothetical protein
MENYSDSDTSSESEYKSSQGSPAGSDCDEDLPSEDLEPEFSAAIHDDEFDYSLSIIGAQLQAQHNSILLAQLHSDIKAQTQLSNPTYQKLSWLWPTQLFDVRILPDYVQYPIHYFELFWGSEVWNTLVENTNVYIQYKKAQHKENKTEEKSRW